MQATECAPGIVLLSGSFDLIISQILKPNHVYYAVCDGFEDDRLAQQIVQVLRSSVRRRVPPTGVEIGVLNSSDNDAHCSASWTSEQANQLSKNGINPILTVVVGGEYKPLTICGQQFLDADGEPHLIFSNKRVVPEFHPDFLRLFGTTNVRTQNWQNPTVLECVACGSTSLVVHQLFADFSHNNRSHMRLEVSADLYEQKSVGGVVPTVAGLHCRCTSCGVINAYSITEEENYVSFVGEAL